VGEQLIARPPPGKVLSLEARAEGRAPRTIVLTADSPERVEVKLEPAPN
jgi:hypothetical protein